MRGAALAMGLFVLGGLSAWTAHAQSSCDVFGVGPQTVNGAWQAGDAEVTIAGPDGCSYYVSAYGYTPGAGNWLYTDQSDVTIQGDAAVLTIYWDANDAGPARSGTVVVKGPSQQATVRVTQQGVEQSPGDACRDASLSRGNLFFDQYGGSATVLLSVGPDCAWQAGSDPWIGVSPASGRGSATLSVTAIENIDHAARVGHVTAAGASLVVSQSGQTDGSSSSSGPGAPPLGARGNASDAHGGEYGEPGPEAGLVLGAVAAAALIALRRRSA